MWFPLEHRRASPGATLLEVVTVILVILILVAIMLPVYVQIQSRAEKVACTSNLHSLHVAASSYLQDHQSWPQIKTKGVDATDVATSWIKTFQPYGLTQNNWICRAEQRALQNPDLTDHDNARIDYRASSFDTNPRTPFRWATQPWFAETGDVHGNGNLIIFPDGHIQELNDLLKTIKPASHPATAAH